MEGAVALDVSAKAKKLLNLDSENEGIMLVSCAGGCSTVCELGGMGKERRKSCFYSCGRLKGRTFRRGN